MAGYSFAAIALVASVILGDFCLCTIVTKPMVPGASILSKRKLNNGSLSKLQLIKGTIPTACKSPQCMTAQFRQLYYGKAYGPWIWVRFLDSAALHCVCMDFAHKYKLKPGNWIEEIDMQRHFKNTFYWKDGKKIVLDAIRCHYLRASRTSNPEWVSYYLAESYKPNDAFVFDETEDMIIKIEGEVQNLRSYLH